MLYMMNYDLIGIISILGQEYKKSVKKDAKHQSSQVNYFIQLYFSIQILL